MAFGAQFLNGSSQTIIDTETPRLVVSASGRYGAYSSTQGGADFAQTITSQEPPMVFLAPDRTGQPAVNWFVPIGSPGAWTGFRFTYTRITTSGSPQVHGGSYFCATLAVQLNAHWGLRLWNGSGTPIFDSDLGAAVFTRAYQNWTYTNYTTDDQGYYVNYYKIDDSIPAANEYVLVSNLVQMLAGGAIGRNPAIGWDFTTNQLKATTVALANPFAFYLSVIFAKKTS